METQLIIDEPDPIYVTAQSEDDPDSFRQASWGVRPSVNVGDVVLFYIGGSKQLGHAGRAASKARRNKGDKYYRADFEPSSYFQFDSPITLDELKADKELSDWSVLSGRPFTRLDEQQPDPLQGPIRDAVVRLIEKDNPEFREWLTPQPRVWLTAGSPESNPDVNLEEWLPGDQHGWAVSSECRHGDYVFFWVTSRGFAYITRAVGPVRPASEDEYGPMQTTLRVVARIEPPLTFSMFKSDAVLKDWHLVKINMNAPARNQRTNLLEDAKIWAAFRTLLVQNNPYLEDFLQKVERAAPTANLLTSRLSGYSRDVPSGARDADLLNLTADVRTLATTLCAKRVEPPLAIGLFGEWGSGKSFFMKQVIREVDDISSAVAAEKKSQSPSEVEFFEHIFQIEFNAWHYSEGNLWASLVDHIFNSLRDKLRNKPDGRNKADEEIQNLLTELESAERAQDEARQKIEMLQAKIDDAERELKATADAIKDEEDKLIMAQRKDAWEGVTFAGLSDRVRNEIENLGKEHGMPEISGDIHKLVAVSRRLVTTGGRSHAIFRSLRQQGLQPWRILMLLGVLALAFFAGPIIQSALTASGRNESISSVSAALAQLVTLVAGGAVWARGRIDWLGERLKEADAFLDSVEEAGSEVEKQLRENERRRNKDVADAEAEIARLRVEREAAWRQQSEAESRQIELISQIDERQPERLLADFIEERASSSDYRDKLGVMALVRRDFQRLSDLLLYQRDPGRKKLEVPRRSKKPLPNIERIILYIDDLDRCREDRVVEVLRAVHLLLAFDIFIVVVAVDARWVARSLELEHQQLLVRSDGDGENVQLYSHKAPAGPPPKTTSVDYLEKIFQVPFWVRPFGKRAAGRMVNGLLKNQIELSASEGDTGSPVVESPDVERIIAQFEEPSSAPLRQLPEKRSLAPDGLKLTPNELQVLVRLAPLAGQTPRQIKRFTNLYRLVKVGLGERDLETFLGLGGNGHAGFESAAVALAMVTGTPRATLELFQLMQATSDNVSLEQLAKNIQWNVDDADPESDPLTFAVRQIVTNNPEVREAAGRLQSVAASFPHVSVGRVKPWLPTVARYSFAGTNSG